MYATFDLSTGSPQLETYFTIFDALPEFSDGLDADILEGMLEAGMEVSEERLDGAFILDIP